MTLFKDGMFLSHLFTYLLIIMFNLIIKEIESSTETSSYCTIAADSIPDDIVTVFGQNAYLYVFGLPVPWEILYHSKTSLSWCIAMEYIDTSCEHVVRYLHKSNSNITSIEITNTIM